MGESHTRLPVAPLYAKSLGIATGRIGFINSAFFLVAACLSLPMGRLSDRWGRKRLAGAGMLLLALTAFSLSVCRSFSSLTLAYLMFGAGTAAFGPTMMAFVAHISPVSHLGRSYGWYTTAIFCGMSLGPAAGGFLAGKLGFIPLHAQEQGLAVERIGLIFFVQGLCNALSRIPFGHLSDRVADRGRLVILGLLAFALSMAGFGASRTAVHFILFALVLGGGMGLAFTSIGALVAQSVTPEMRGVAMGGYNTCIYSGMMISSAVMGQVCEAVGFRPPETSARAEPVKPLDVEHLIVGYGYLFLLAGAMLEGETFLVAAAVLAQQGYLDLEWVILTAFIGGFAANQFCFLLGRTRGMAFLRKRENWQAKARRVFALMKRFENALVLGLHFLYGLRTVTPFAIGASGFSHPRFFVLNAVGVMAWAVVVGGLGYQFGYLVVTFIEEAKKYQPNFMLFDAVRPVLAACESFRYNHFKLLPLYCPENPFVVPKSLGSAHFPFAP